MIKGGDIASPGIKQLVKKMPVHVWLLRKGAFESFIICGLLVVLFFYIKYVPIFKGYLPVYMCFSALSWFFLRLAVWKLNYKLSLHYTFHYSYKPILRNNQYKTECGSTW
jgi:hypothetical protein